MWSLLKRNDNVAVNRVEQEQKTAIYLLLFACFHLIRVAVINSVLAFVIF